MPLTHSRRKAAALAVATSGLATVLTGTLAPVATAAPADAPAVSGSTTDSSWFVDPRTRAERRAEIAVPNAPKKYRGKAVETRAVYRTGAGKLAVPMRYALGHQLEEGQAVTISGDALFDPKRVARLADALANATSIRCEGYADYAGKELRKSIYAGNRAARVCWFLEARNEGLEAIPVSYGVVRPAVVSSKPKDRKLNRRVVVEMTGAVTAAHLPSAPVGLTASGADGVLDVTFGGSESTGGPSVTGYSISYDGGVTWAPASLSGDAPWTVSAGGFTNGTTYDVRVRAENRWGHGAAAGTSALVSTVPDAPTSVSAVANGTTVTVSFVAPAFDGGTAITGYEVQVDDGAWVPAGADPTATLSNQGFGTHVYSVRAVNVAGHSVAATSNAVEIAQSGPRAYRAEYQSGRAYTDLWFDKTPGADGYEAQLDDGSWLPVTVFHDFGEQAYGYLIDPVCGSSGCTHNRTIVMRAVTGGVAGQPGQPFTVTFLG